MARSGAKKSGAKWYQRELWHDRVTSAIYCFGLALLLLVLGLPGLLFSSKQWFAAMLLVAGVAMIASGIGFLRRRPWAKVPALLVNGAWLGFLALNIERWTQLFGLLLPGLMFLHFWFYSDQD